MSSPESEIAAAHEVALTANSVFEVVRGAAEGLDPDQRRMLGRVIASFATGSAQGVEQDPSALGSIERATGPRLVSRTDLANFAKTSGSRVNPDLAWRILCGYSSPHFLPGGTQAAVTVDGVIRSAIGVYDENGDITPSNERLKGRYMDVRHAYDALWLDCNYPLSSTEDPTGAARFPERGSARHTLLVGFVEEHTGLRVQLRLPGDPGMPGYDMESMFLRPVRQVGDGPARVVTPDCLAEFAELHGGVDRLGYWEALFARIAKQRANRGIYTVRGSDQEAFCQAMPPELFADIVRDLEEMGSGQHPTTYSRKARDTAVRYIRAISSQQDYLARL